MKTDPTDLDREAATLFRPAPGMRAWMPRHDAPEFWWRVVGDWNATWEGHEEVVHDFSHEHGDPFHAFDTDDPATLGCMLAQVEEAAGATADLRTVPARDGKTLHEIAFPGVGTWRDFTRAASLVKAMAHIVAAMRAAGERT